MLPPPAPAHRYLPLAARAGAPVISDALNFERC